MAPTDTIQEGEENSLSQQLEALRQNNQAELDKLRAEDDAKEPSTFTKIAQAVATIGIPALIGAAMGGKNGATLGAGQGGSAYGKYLTAKSKEDNAREGSIRKARLESLKNTQKALQDTLILPEKEKIKAQAQADAFELRMPMYEKLARINAGLDLPVPDPIRDATAQSLVDAGVAPDIETARQIASTVHGEKQGNIISDNKTAAGGLDLRKDKLEMDKAKSIIGPGVVIGENANLDPKEAPKIRDFQGGVAGLLNHIKMLKQGFIDNAKRNGGIVNYSDDPEGKLGITYRQLFGKINAINGYGKALTGNELPFISGQLPAMPDSSRGLVEFAKNEVFGRNPLRMLDTLAENLRSDTKEILRAKGLAIPGQTYSPSEASSLGIAVDSNGKALPQDTSGFLTAGRIANRNRKYDTPQNPGFGIVQEFVDRVAKDPKIQPGRLHSLTVGGRKVVFKINEDREPIYPNPEDQSYLEELMGAHGKR